MESLDEKLAHLKTMISAGAYYYHFDTAFNADIPNEAKMYFADLVINGYLAENAQGGFDATQAGIDAGKFTGVSRLDDVVKGSPSEMPDPKSNKTP